MARTSTGFAEGHSHQYTEQVSSPNRSNQTSIINGHSHPIKRDDNGRAIRIGRTDNHTHKLK